MSTLIKTVERISKDYETLRKTDVSSRNGPIRELLDTLRDQLTEVIDPALEHVRVHRTLGSGNLPKTPVLYFFDERGSTSGQRGVYCALIFQPDPTEDNYGSVTLALTQGFKELEMEYGEDYKDILAANARRLAAKLDTLSTADLSAFQRCALSPLQHTQVLTKAYPTATSINERDFIQDINAVLSALLALHDPFSPTPEGEGDQRLLSPS